MEVESKPELKPGVERVATADLEEPKQPKQLGRMQVRRMVRLQLQVDERDANVTDAWIDELFNEFEVDKSSYMDDTEWEKLIESLGTRVEGRARMTAKCQSLETSDGAEYARSQPACCSCSLAATSSV
eukprot:COSAG02_NODE_10540_length_1918_cov_2.516218_3_plen_128_part_00